MRKIEKLKNFKKLTKIAIVLSIFLISTIVIASLILYFGEIETELDIETSVTIDNHSYNKPIKHNFKLQSGDSISVIHTFRNKAKTCNVMINETTSGLVEGITLMFYSENNSLITIPFRLDANSSMKIIMVYHADINLKSQKVKIITKFSVSEI